MEWNIHPDHVEALLLEKAKAGLLPVNGSLELLPLCNMSCNICFVQMGADLVRRSGGILPGRFWLDIGRQMQKAGTLFTLLTGGEPLLHPDFKMIYEGLMDLGLILTVNTNGTLIDQAWADFFARRKPRRINITLYGASEETYGRLCHYPSGFQKAVNGIRLLKEGGIDVLVTGSLAPENLHEIKAIHEIARDLNCPLTFDYYMMPARRERGQAYNKEARASALDMAAARIQIIEAKVGLEGLRTYAREEVARIRRLIDQEDRRPYEGTCMAGRCSFSINWQGKVQACVMNADQGVSLLKTNEAGGDTEDSLFASYSSNSADVGEDAFAKAWNRVGQAFRKTLVNPECRSCPYGSLCPVCPVSAFHETGDYQGVPGYLCDFSREVYRLLEGLVDSDDVRKQHVGDS